MKGQKNKYYSLNNILKANADYNIIIGERSNGKTFSVLEYILKEHVKSGYKKQGAVIRRWKEDILPKRMQQMYSAVVETGMIEKLTDGKYTNILYSNSKFWLTVFDDTLNKWVASKEPFAYGFALSDMEHDKSTSYPNVTTILFDEFLTRRYYLPEEFTLFLNVLSTIIRDRGNVKIFMLGNTVNKFCPYFAEMGLLHVPEMEQGKIDIYQFGAKNQLTIAVEYAEASEHEKESNKYFCFDDAEAVNMIIGGKWELAVYPRLEKTYSKKDVVFEFFIIFYQHTLHAEIIMTKEENYIYIHEKTTPIKNPDTDLIYSLEHKQKVNYKRRIFSSNTPLEKRIAEYFALEKVFFQNNEVGEIVRNYIQQSQMSQFARK